MANNFSNEPFYYRNRNLVVGLFVLLPFLIVVVLLITTAIRSDLLESWIVYNLKCETGAGIMAGRTPVKIMGIDVGNVTSVNLNDDGYVDVQLRIKNRYGHFIRKNSVAHFRQKNIVVGDWEINLSPGTFDKRNADFGDTLGVQYAIRLEDFMELTSDFMSPLQDIVQSLNEGTGLMKYILGEDTLMTEIHNLLGEVEYLLGDARGTLKQTDRVINNFTNFGTRGTNMVDSLMMFSSHADSMISNLNSSVNGLDTLINNLDDVPKDFGRVMDELSVELGKMDMIFKGLENHWLLRKSIKKQRKEMESLDESSSK